MSLPFDQERYRTEVLDPARRKTQELPGDLLVRYAVPPEAEQNAPGFAEHLEEVEKYWRSLGQQHRSYRELTNRLLAAHEQLRERRELSYAFFVDQSREHRQEALAKLENRIRALAQQGPVPRSQLEPGPGEPVHLAYGERAGRGVVPARCRRGRAVVAARAGLPHPAG